MPRTSEPASSSRFTAEELRTWRARLVAARREAAGDRARVVADAEADGDASQATDALDAAQTVDDGIASAEIAEALVREIDRAIRKIDRAEPCPFGVCELTGEAIEPDRLELMPWTPYCAGAALRTESV